MCVSDVGNPFCCFAGLLGVRRRWLGVGSLHIAFVCVWLCVALLGKAGPSVRFARGRAGSGFGMSFDGLVSYFAIFCLAVFAREVRLEEGRELVGAPTAELSSCWLGRPLACELRSARTTVARLQLDRFKCSLELHLSGELHAPLCSVTNLYRGTSGETAVPFVSSSCGVSDFMASFQETATPPEAAPPLLHFRATIPERAYSRKKCPPSTLNSQPRPCRWSFQCCRAHKLQKERLAHRCLLCGIVNSTLILPIHPYQHPARPLPSGTPERCAATVLLTTALVTESFQPLLQGSAQPQITRWRPHQHRRRCCGCPRSTASPESAPHSSSGFLSACPATLSRDQASANSHHSDMLAVLTSSFIPRSALMIPLTLMNQLSAFLDGQQGGSLFIE